MMEHPNSKNVERPNKILLELAYLAAKKHRASDRLTPAQAAAQVLEEIVGPRHRFAEKEFGDLVEDIAPYMRFPDSFPLSDLTLGKERASEEGCRAYILKRLTANDNQPEKNS